MYPLRLEPQVKEVVWGGRWLADELGRTGASQAKLGESWEAYSNSQISNGEFAGQTLNDLFNRFGTDFFGKLATTYPKFPLLVKFIDANANLSVQVHPNDEQALELESYPFGKTEFWYIMEAKDDAALYYGLNDTALTREDLKTALEQEVIMQYLQKSPVRPGDVIFLPAGTIHALTEGIVVYELQQDSDITYRLYDWGRVGRQMHVEKGLQVINLEYKNMPVTHPELITKEGYSIGTLVNCPYFIANIVGVKTAANLNAAPDSFSLISTLSAGGTLTSPDNRFEPMPLKKGETVLIPANLNYTLEGNFRAICSWLVAD
jgi:mannose-6-phosphate isomerase